MKIIYYSLYSFFKDKPVWYRIRPKECWPLSDVTLWHFHHGNAYAYCHSITQYRRKHCDTLFRKSIG